MKDLIIKENYQNQNVVFSTNLGTLSSGNLDAGTGNHEYFQKVIHKRRRISYDINLGYEDYRNINSD